MPFSRLRFALPSPLLLLVLLAGCGGNKASVTGTVSFDGQPLNGGAITLTPSGSKTPVASGSIVEGKYTIPATDKLTPGTYSVEIVWMKGTGKKVKSENSPGLEVQETKQVIPAEYNTATKLTTEVKSGSNTANFELKAGGPVSSPSPVAPVSAGGIPAPGALKKAGHK